MDIEARLNQLFDVAKTSPVQVPFERTATTFIQQSAGLKGKNTFSWLSRKTVLIMLSILSIIGIILFNLPLETPSVNVDQKEKVETEKRTMIPLGKKERKVVTTIQVTESSEPLEKIEAPHEVPETAFKKSEELNQFESTSNKTQVPPKQKSASSLYTPELSEKEIKENNKLKKRMAKALLKFDDEDYAYIPSGSANLNGTVISVQGFIIGRREVSVKEYKVFLFDLLIQGRKADFHKAKPDFEQWKTIANNDNLVSDYFNDVKFQDYPINNISREGAEMYCKWLTMSVVEMFDSEINDVRIPTRSEWEFAASSQGKFKSYPWGTDSLINQTGNYMANFDFLSDTLSNVIADTEKFKKEWTYTTVPGKTYNPTDFGLYNLSGNVAEMVNNDSIVNDLSGYIYSNGSNSPGTAGGGWMDAPENVKIYGQDKYDNITTAHPNIGFRVVLTYLSKSTLQRIKKGVKKSSSPTHLSLSKRTKKEELMSFMDSMKDVGWHVECSSNYLGDKLVFLKLSMTNGNNSKDCGGVFFKGFLSNERYSIQYLINKDKLTFK